MKFIDIHNHLIAHWDDGAEDWDMSLEMLRQGMEDGIEQVICTPHILSTNDLQREDEVISLYEELKRRAKEAGIPIKIHLGAELYIQPDMMLDRKICTLAQNGRYFLVEFSMSMIPDFVAQKFFDYLLEDKIPIIAHPERNVSIINAPQKAYEFVERGALLQVNAGSLYGIFGSRVQTAAVQLMDANLVHFIASDGHDLNKRPLLLRKAFEIVKEKWGDKRAEKLFYENQVKMINAEDISPGDFQMISSRQLSFREKISNFINKIN